MKQNVLIISGDPFFQNSVMNKRVLEILKEKLPSAEFDQLDILYPNYQIDVEAEQNKLLKADTIVIESPIYWYSFTSLIRRWMEEVLTPGWAYGYKGEALKGKNIILSLTAGGSEKMYTPGPECRISKEQVLAPLKVIFDYCLMNNAGILFNMGIAQGQRSDEEWKEFIEEKAQEQARFVVDSIQNLEKKNI